MIDGRKVAMYSRNGGDYNGNLTSFRRFNEFEKSAPEPMTVDELTQQIKGLLEPSFRSLCVVGEISGFSTTKGHGYFTLKDESSQIPGIIWRTALSKLPFTPENGMRVVCYGRLEVYARGGKYNFITNRMEPVGVGMWEKRLRELQLKFEKEGLFAPERKKPLPYFIRNVGVVTSRTGAALRDFINTLSLDKGIGVVLAPTRVQGVGAAREIAAALRALNENATALELDAIALIRGGGSVEDLWEFNEEPSVRAVADSEVPVVSGIGHEIDTSLCDLAADVHTLTPTAAAHTIATVNADFYLDIDDWSQRIRNVVERNLENALNRLSELSERPVFKDPSKVIWDRKIEILSQMESRLVRGIEASRDRHESRFREAVGRLEAMSPLAVLARGYSITRNLDTGKILRKASDVKNGVIETRLDEGTLCSLVMEGGASR